MRTAARADENERAIVHALQQAGHVVWRIRWPVDLLIRPARGTRWLPMEVKNPDNRSASLTDDQRQFILLAGNCPVAVVSDVEGALRAVQAVIEANDEQTRHRTT